MLNESERYRVTTRGLTRSRVIYGTTRHEKKNEDIIQAVNIRPLGEIIEEARLR